jgi:hypothetical protein
MSKRRYYSLRTGVNPDAARLDLPFLLGLFNDFYEDLAERGYFQEAFGYYCVDAGEVPGRLGKNIEAQFFYNYEREIYGPLRESMSTTLRMIYLTSLNFFSTGYPNPFQKVETTTISPVVGGITANLIENLDNMSFACWSTGCSTIIKKVMSYLRGEKYSLSHLQA